jgi:hypothetical protein
MKQYTTPKQTAKLIELGLPKPRYYCADKYTIIHTGFDIINYSIGELLSFLPPKIWDDYAQIYLELCIDWDIIGNVWRVVYFHKAMMRCYGKELIDALFNMVLRLKEEGVI